MHWVTLKKYFFIFTMAYNIWNSSNLSALFLTVQVGCERNCVTFVDTNIEHAYYDILSLKSCAS